MREGHVCFIIPPEILKTIALNPAADEPLRSWAIEELTRGATLRAQRAMLLRFATVVAVPTGTKRRTVYDAGHQQSLPGELRRGEKDPPTADPVVNRAFDYSGATYDFYDVCYHRKSVDDKGMRLDSTVHYGDRYSNAFWNGMQMVYGDGDGRIFGDFTQCPDIVGHELTHGVTQFEAALEYHDQPGALNEHFSDVFGSLVKQWMAGQSTDQADWLIGNGIFIPLPVPAKGHRTAVRSMADPGTAYDDPLIGKDPQVAHMSKYVRTSDDDGGVHINSGIPNKAFCTFARSLGGKAWEAAGSVWYTVLRDRLRPSSTFQECADLTYAVALDLYGQRISDLAATAWENVGITVKRAKNSVGKAGRKRGA